jgi:hypothetical protein
VSANLPDDWNDVTAQHGPAELLAALVPPESGTHRITRPRALGELEAERDLPRDVLSSIVTEYLAYFAGPARGAALRAVREGLESVGGSERAVPQALAGQLVLTLAHQLSSGDRDGFLATAWVILATTGLRNTG